MENCMTFLGKHSSRMNVQKLKRAFRILFMLLLTIAVSPLACTPANLPMPTEDPGLEALTIATVTETSPLTFLADADAQVNEASPEENTGTSKFLQVDGNSGAEIES